MYSEIKALPIVAEVKLEQVANALYPTLVTELGIDIEVNAVQP